MADPSLPPRIAPGGRKELGLVQWLLLTIGAKKVGGPIPNVMSTLARRRGILVPWVLYSSRLMPSGKLPASNTELVILRVASRCGSHYERVHHTALGHAAGLGDAIIAWTTEPPGTTAPPPAGDGIDPDRARLLVRAADELLDTRDLSDETWAALAAVFDDERLIELCLLVGHYAGLASALNALRVPVERGAGMNKLRQKS